MSMSTGTGKVVQTLPERTADDLQRGDVVTEISEKFGCVQLGRDGVMVVFDEDGAVSHYGHIWTLAEHGQLTKVAFVPWRRQGGYD